MKKPGHHQAGEERAEGRRRELPPKSALATSPDTTLDNSKGEKKPTRNTIRRLNTKTLLFCGSSSHATVPKLGKRIAAMGRAPCIFSCESHWISKTVTGKLLHTQDVNKDNLVPL